MVFHSFAASLGRLALLVAILLSVGTSSAAENPATQSRGEARQAAPGQQADRHADGAAAGERHGDLAHHGGSG